ncbi:two-component system, OmpR family, sensor histidine kinase MprB [Allokutzneria albata]|uniref:histidine kinase n=2 Tax=Allokutzneria albata TaxID=211114 RepID=A0A1H0B3U1_ALLAB|nr:HAMP domain-containing sensor histidine kinase [Allokutzneria albata]SDN40309.1 two-component system, OmpR family, sensor histidine kinase MprB [Allokutzneria albata]
MTLPNGMRQRFSLQSRITALAAFGVGFAVALVSLAAYITVRSSLYSQLETKLEDQAREAVSTAIAQSDFGGFPSDVFQVFGLKVALLEVDRTGHLTLKVGSGGRATAPAVDRAEIEVALGTNDSNSRVDTKTDTQIAAVNIRPGLALVLGQSLVSTKATLNRLGVVLVVVGGAGILLAAAAGTAVARGSLRPVKRLTEAAEHVARTAELRPIPITGDDELARLTQAFNSMLAALSESQERQRRLVADAGHELRTPLTSLRTNLELLLASQRVDTPNLSEEDRAEIYEDVRAQVNELSTLVGDLVELARDDAPGVVHEPVDMVDVVERALERARRRAPNLEFDASLRPWVLDGDANALERAALNLLDNAAKWSPPGGRVRVELRQAGQGVGLLEVADAGNGIADADLPHVFERFYRSSEARTLPGSGLGLAIVKQVAERHGGTATAGHAPEGGALMSIWLPGRPG